MRTQRRMKKDAIGASSVDLIPSTDGDGENRPGYLVMSKVVVSTGGVTPDAYFWGTVTGDGKQYLVTIEEVT